MKYYKLHLIRHGLTQGNLDGLYVGSATDLPLCAEGRAQLKTLRKDFVYPRVDTVFVSPLLRAKETAEILFPEARHTYEITNLKEMNFGKFENLLPGWTPPAKPCPRALRTAWPFISAAVRC